MKGNGRMPIGNWRHTAVFKAVAIITAAVATLSRLLGYDGHWILRGEQVGGNAAGNP